MNHIRYFLRQSSCTVFNACHPERSPATSEASRQTQSKDPYKHDAAGGQSGNFRVVVRFFDEGDLDSAQAREYLPGRSREAAEECSPRRKPWGITRTFPSPVGAKEAPPGQKRK